MPKLSQDSLAWRLDGGPSVSIQVSGGNMYAFNDTLDYLGKLEDPNQEFPPGHFLPLPIGSSLNSRLRMDFKPCFRLNNLIPKTYLIRNITIAIVPDCTIRFFVINYYHH